MAAGLMFKTDPATGKYGMFFAKDASGNVGAQVCTTDGTCCTITPCTLTCTGGSVAYKNGVIYDYNNTYKPWIGGVQYCLTNIPLNVGISSNGYHGKITSLGSPQDVSWLRNPSSNNPEPIALHWGNTNVGNFQYYSDSTFTTPTTSVAITATVTFSIQGTNVPECPPGTEANMTWVRVTIATADGNVTFFDAVYTLDLFTQEIDQSADPADPLQWVWRSTACAANGTGGITVPTETAGMSACLQLCLDWVCTACGDTSYSSTPWFSPKIILELIFSNVAYTNPPVDSSCSFFGDATYTAENWTAVASSLGQYEVVLSCDGQQLIINNRVLCDIDPNTGPNPNQTALCHTNNNGTETCAIMTIECNGPTYFGVPSTFALTIQGGVDGRWNLPLSGTVDLETAWYASSTCTDPPRLSGTLQINFGANACKVVVDGYGNNVGVPVDFPNPA